MKTLTVLSLWCAIGCTQQNAASTVGTGGSLGADAGDPSGAGGGAGADAPNGLPCDVNAVLATNCRTCHAATPLYGAPMPLVTYDDLHAPATSDPSQPVYALVKTRIHDMAHPMPPSGHLDQASMGVLDAWLNAGAPRSDEASCGSGGQPDGGSGPAVGPAALPCTPSVSFVAHASGGSAPYHVPTAGAENEYECFTFRSPFDGKRQGTAWAPIISDARVLHHWILYRTATAQPDGGVMPCNMPTDATFVAGWAPGGTNYVLPDDIGLELGGPSDNFILQMHYHNAAHLPDANDASGVAFCTTDTPRTHEAGVFTVGTVLINIPKQTLGYQTSGTCGSASTWLLPQPVNIIAAFPHMHGTGASIRTEIHRGSDFGPVDTVVDVEHFSFDDQVYYPKTPPIVFHPGDSITTTCVYNNPSMQPIQFGERTEDEMCFDFLMLYPINIFSSSARSCGLF